MRNDKLNTPHITPINFNSSPSPPTHTQDTENVSLFGGDILIFFCVCDFSDIKIATKLKIHIHVQLAKTHNLVCVLLACNLLGLSSCLAVHLCETMRRFSVFWDLLGSVRLMALKLHTHNCFIVMHILMCGSSMCARVRKRSHWITFVFFGGLKP